MLLKISLPLFIIVLSGVLGPASGGPPIYTGSVDEYYRRLRESLYSLYHQTGRETGPIVEHEWVSLEYDWPCEYVKQFYTERGWYVPETNFLSGIDVYQGEVYVTVFRIGPTVPSGLNKVVRKNGKSLLQPFPSLSMNERGDCSKLQYPFATQTDPNTGYMYVLDNGRTERINAPLPEECPPKIVVLDLNNGGAVVRSHDLPESVTSTLNNTLINDIALDYVTRNGTEIRYAYITDTGNEQLIVFDFKTNTSWAFQHESMVFDEGRLITINDITYNQNVSIDGITIDPDFEYVYYCPVGSLKLSQIPTSVLRDPSGDFAGSHRYVGNKMSQSDGLLYGQENLYYGAESLNAVYKWEVSNDMIYQELDEGSVRIKTQTLIAEDNERYNWIDSLKLDSEGYLWFTTTRVHEVLANTIDFSGDRGSNFRINKVYVGEKSYLWREGE